MRVAKSRVEIEDLAARMVAGEEQAYVEFADTFGLRLRSYFIKRGLSLSDADDLTASCLTDIALRIEKYRPMKPGGFEAWVFTLAYHFLIDWIRSRRDVVDLPEDFAAPELQDQQEPHFGIILAVREAVEKLDEADRFIVELRHLDAPHSYAEIGERLGITVGAARVRHFRALNKLQTLLEKDLRIIDYLRSNERGNHG